MQHLHKEKQLYLTTLGVLEQLSGSQTCLSWLAPIDD